MFSQTTEGIINNVDCSNIASSFENIRADFFPVSDLRLRAFLFKRQWRLILNAGIVFVSAKRQSLTKTFQNYIFK